MEPEGDREQTLYSRLGSEFETDDPCDAGDPEHIEQCAKRLLAELDDIGADRNSGALQGRWGLYGISTRLVLMGGNFGGECHFRIDNVIGCPGSESDEEQPPSFMQVSGSWERAEGSLELRLTFDLSSFDPCDGLYVKPVESLLRARAGQVVGKLSTDPGDGMPFAVVLLLAVPDIDCPEGRVDVPWIFNVFEPGETSLEYESNGDEE